MTTLETVTGNKNILKDLLKVVDINKSRHYNKYIVKQEQSSKGENKMKKQTVEQALELVSNKMLDINYYDTEVMDKEDFEREIKEIYKALQLAEKALEGKI